jgi:hypothetical protein
MTTIKRKIAELKVMASSTNPKYRANSDEVIKLFTERKIEKFKEAEKLLTQNLPVEAKHRKVPLTK